MKDWRFSFPIRQLRVRPLACFALAFLMGALLAQRASVPMAAGIAACSAAVVAAAACFSKGRRLAAALCLLILGVGAGIARTDLAFNALAPVETRYSVTMTGRIDSNPFIHPRTGRCIARFLPRTINEAPSDLRLRLYLRGEDADALRAIAYGQTLTVKGHIWANDPVTNPDEFDFGAYLHRNGMDAIATARIEDVDVLDQARDLRSAVYDIRDALGRRIDALFPKSAAMVRALILGDRSLMTDEQRKSFNATGTAHLISISGLHVTLLAMALTAALRRFMPPWRANLLVAGPLLLYGALIGFPSPFVRALAMFLMLGASKWFGLPSDPITRLSAVLLGFLLARPLLLTDAGFVLSFSAFAGVILLTPPLRALLGTNRLPAPGFRQRPFQRLARRAAQYVSELLCASLAAQLATLPAVIAWFGVQSVVSIPYNLVCVPLCMAGYALALASVAISLPLYALGALLAAVPDGLLAVLTDLTRRSAALPVTTVRIGRYPLWLISIHAIVILAASDLARTSLRRRKYLPLALIAVAGLSSALVWARCLPFGVTFLDAGQADCAVLTTRGHTYVFDAGDTYTPAADYLNANCLHLDGVFLSHPHADHAGGLQEILESYRPEVIYVPRGWFEVEDIAESITAGMERAKAMGIPVVELSAGDALPLSEDVALSVYNPDGDADDVNDLSLLLLARSSDRSVLFTGDLTTSGEPETIPDCDVLKVAHHGAENATSARFLEAATPEYAIISVGENKFGHPSDLTLKRLRDAGAQVVRTDQRGAIRVTATREGWRIRTYLEAKDELE